MPQRAKWCGEIGVSAARQPSVLKFFQHLFRTARILTLLQALAVERGLKANGYFWGCGDVPNLSGQRNVGCGVCGYSTFSLSNHFEGVEPLYADLQGCS